MGATNRTQNYNLPQFVGSDKPTWLGDFNGAMSSIDTQMKANNDLGTTANTTANTALENSASAQGTANTALNDSATAQSTANSALQKALTNESNIAKINLDTFTTFSKTDINVINNSFSLSNTDTTSLTLATNSDGSLCKIYGSIFGTSSASEMVNFYIQTDLRPTTNININPCALIYTWDRSNTLNSKVVSVAPLTIETDGKIRIRAGAVGGQYLRIVLLPMLYFVKNFGDLQE
jgi:hypothetical protein